MRCARKIGDNVQGGTFKKSLSELEFSVPIRPFDALSFLS